MINKKYNDPGVKEYLNAGTHFDQHPPEWWRTNKVTTNSGDALK